MQIRLKVDDNRLTVDDLIALDEGTVSKPRVMRDLMARFLVDEAGEYLPDDAARKAIGALTVTQLKKVIEQFTENVNALKIDAVNPTPGNVS